MAEVEKVEGRGWALLATSLGFAVVQLDVSVINVAIQPIGAELGGSVAGLQWVVNAYTVAFAVLILSAGALGDRIGARRVFLAGFGLFTVASAACGLALAALAAAAFVLVEARRPGPMLPLGLFRSGSFTAATAIGLAVNVALYGLIFVLSLYFQRGRGWSVLATGLAFAPTTAAVLAGNLAAGRFTGRVGTQRTLVGAAAVLAAALAGLLPAGADTPYPVLAGPLAVAGFALGVLVPAITAALLGSIEPARSGVASGTLNTARQTGSVLGVSLFGALATGGLVHGLHLAAGISVALAAACALVALAVPADPG